MINNQQLDLNGDLIITVDDFDSLIMENDKEFQKNLQNSKLYHFG